MEENAMEDEWEEEEQLVVAELSGIINSDFLTKCQGTCKVVGIDSDRPIIQVGPYVFAGEYENALGTCVIFEEKPKADAEPDASPELKYKCHTAKKLMMQRTFLSERKDDEPNSGGIEVLALNEGEVFGRPNNMVCNYLQQPKEEGGADPKETVGLRVSDDSDVDEAEIEPLTLAGDLEDTVENLDNTDTLSPAS